MTTNSSIKLKEEFNEFFPEIIKKISEHSKKSKFANSFNLDYAIDKMEKMLKYTVADGKQTRGLTVITSYYDICGSEVSEETKKMLFCLGWAIEVLQASFLVADDVMDNSETRRGKKCWYKLPGVGLSAINDAFILESCTFILLKVASKNQPFYTDLVDLFHTIMLNTEIGQSLDMATTDAVDLDDFSLFNESHHRSVVTYKTSFYSFYLPVAIALYASGNNDEALHKKTCEILLKIGELFQVQDDYLDCYGDPEVTGKIGTDIEDRKCSWLIVEAFKRGSKSQIDVLKANYGQKDVEKVSKVKVIYEDLNLKSVYKDYEETFFEKIKEEIENFQDDRVPSSIFLDLLKKIYKRQK